jgi:hypothetical protein
MNHCIRPFDAHTGIAEFVYVGREIRRPRELRQLAALSQAEGWAAGSEPAGPCARDGDD